LIDRIGGGLPEADVDDHDGQPGVDQAEVDEEQE
jgi:hypothetical protein